MEIFHVTLFVLALYGSFTTGQASHCRHGSSWEEHLIERLVLEDSRIFCALPR